MRANVILAFVLTFLLFVPVTVLAENNTPVSEHSENSLKESTRSKESTTYTVMFDDAHGPSYTANPSNPAWTDANSGLSELMLSPSNGGYSWFANALISNGFNVVYLNSGQKITSRVLDANKVDVLIIPTAPEGAFTASEIIDVCSFVNNGGSLFIIGDYGYYSHAVNAISMKFGVTIGTTYPQDYVHYVDYPYPYNQRFTCGNSFIVFTNSIKKTDEINRMINAGVSRVELYTTNILVGYPTWTSKLITTDSDSVPPDTPVAIALRHKKGTNPDGSSIYGGGLVVIGDSDFLCNSLDVDGDGKRDIDDSNNKQFGLNIIKWLASVSNRTKDQKPEYGVSLTANPTASTIPQGSTTNYIIYVQNTGSDLVNKDNITLTIDKSDMPSSWDVSLSTTELQLSSGDVKTVVLTVKTTKEAAGAFNIAVKGTSGMDPNKTSTIVTVTTVNKAKIYGVAVTAYPSEDQFVNPGENVTFKVNITNIGNTLDRYELSVQTSTPSGWTATLSSYLTNTINENETANVNLVVSTPVNAIAGELGRMRVKATSKNDPTKTFGISNQLTINIRKVHKIILSCPDDEHLIKRGTSTNYTVTIKNEGNTEENVVLESFGTFEGWTAKLFAKLSDKETELKSYDKIRISSKGTKTIRLQVTAPDNAIAGSKMGIMVKNADTSPDPELKFDPIFTNTTVRADDNLVLPLSGGSEVLYVDPGDTVDYVFYIKNEGNVNEIPTIDVSNIAGWLRTINDTKPTVPIGGTIPIKLSITVPQNEQTGDYRYRIVVSYKDMNTRAAKEISKIVVVHVNQIYNISIASKQTYFATLPNAVLKGRINITNEGNGPDYINISTLEEYSEWITSAEYRLESGEKKSIDYYIKVPPNPSALPNNITIYGRSVGGESVGKSIISTLYIVVEVKLAELSIGNLATIDRLEERKFVPFTAIVCNNGSIVAPNVLVALFVDNNRIDTYTIENLTSNHTANATLFWQATRGEHEVKVVVDPDNTIREIDELGKEEIGNNNARSMSVYGYESSVFATTVNTYWLIINILAIVILSILTMVIARGTKRSAEEG